MNKILGIFYDLDNTLYPQIIDIEQRIDYCMDKFLFPDKRRIKIYWKKQWKQNGPAKNDLIGKVIQRFNLNLNKNELIYYYRIFNTKIYLEKEIVLLLRKLKNKKVKQFVITNGNELTQSNKIESLKLKQYFNEVIMANDKWAKPSSHWFRALMRKYSLKPQDCISVGDWYAVDGAASESAGIPFVYKDGGPVKERIPDHVKRIRNLIEIEEHII